MTMKGRGGRVVRWCWVNFQYRGVLQFGLQKQGPTALAVGAGGGCLDFFSLIYPFFPLSPSLWETARYRLKYCLKGPLNPKSTTHEGTKRNAPHLLQAKQPLICIWSISERCSKAKSSMASSCCQLIPG